MFHDNSWNIARTEYKDDRNPDSNYSHTKFPTNQMSSAKYNFITFLPLSLLI